MFKKAALLAALAMSGTALWPVLPSAAKDISGCHQERTTSVRLLCYDRATGYTKPSVDYVDHRWKIEERTSPVDGRRTLIATNLDRGSGFTLGARCSDDRIVLMLVAPAQLSGKTVRVIFRVGEGEVQRTEWPVSGGDVVIITPNDRFITDATDKTKLFFRLEESDGRRREATFDVGAWSTVWGQLRKACAV